MDLEKLQLTLLILDASYTFVLYYVHYEYIFKLFFLLFRGTLDSCLSCRFYIVVVSYRTRTCLSICSCN